jgi:hypothetical protein
MPLKRKADVEGFQHPNTKEFHPHMARFWMGASDNVPFIIL